MKISYNIETGYFCFEEKPQIDKTSIEGMAIESYIDKYNLNVQWIDEGGYWGSRDENGTFNGVVGRVRGGYPETSCNLPSSQVGYGEADVGISIISYTDERQTLVDYSHGIGVDAMNWISKPPGKLPPSTNIVRTFDYYSWIMIGVSLLTVRNPIHLFTISKRF